MPKKPSHSSSLRQIREAIGWSQSNLADKLGISVSMLQKVENGLKSLSDESTYRLLFLTGCGSMEENGRLTLVASFQGEPYTSASYSQYESILATTKWDSPGWFPAMSTCLEILTRACLGKPIPRQGISALSIVSAGIRKAMKGLGKKRIVLILEDRSFDLSTDDQVFLMDLLDDPLLAGVEINARRGSASRGKASRDLAAKWKEKAESRLSKKGKEGVKNPVEQRSEIQEPRPLNPDK